MTAVDTLAAESPNESSTVIMVVVGAARMISASLVADFAVVWEAVEVIGRRSGGVAGECSMVAVGMAGYSLGSSVWHS